MCSISLVVFLWHVDYIVCFGDVCVSSAMVVCVFSVVLVHLVLLQGGDHALCFGLLWFQQVGFVVFGQGG